MRLRTGQVREAEQEDDGFQADSLRAIPPRAPEADEDAAVFLLFDALQ
jgi:hypothetical protein